MAPHYLKSGPRNRSGLSRKAKSSLLNSPSRNLPRPDGNWRAVPNESNRSLYNSDLSCVAISELGVRRPRWFPKERPSSARFSFCAHPAEGPAWFRAHSGPGSCSEPSPSFSAPGSPFAFRRPLPHPHPDTGHSAAPRGKRKNSQKHFRIEAPPQAEARWEL